VRDPGTEVSATAVEGESRGPRGRWAVLLRRRRTPVTDRSELDGEASGAAADGSTDTGTVALADGTAAADGAAAPASRPDGIPAMVDGDGGPGDQGHTPEGPAPA
jgi:hypothetical protein